IVSRSARSFPERSIVMKSFTRFTAQNRLLCVLALAAACDPDLDGEGEADPTAESAPPEVAEPEGDREGLAGEVALQAPVEPSALTTSSFVFQHPLTGGSYKPECHFNDLQCAAPGKYHAGIDASASSST